MRIRRRSVRRASLTRRVASFAVLGMLTGLLTVAVPLLHPEPVSAASGVDDYPSRLKSAPLDALVDPWQFYNRECTSFVAWRLNSENQVAFNDYWQGQHWGNASNWKKAAVALKIPVDNNPTRGSVAWWAAGSAGSSRGHVAWVQTVGSGAITIEEYNYLHRGGYSTRTISSSSSLWPSGFIHIKDTQLRNTASPVVSGTPQVGQKLTTTRGSWSAKHLDFSYQWLSNGTVIKGATSRTLKVAAAQLGTTIRAKVTATKSGAHSGTAQSAPTDQVAKGVFVNTVAPSVPTKAQVGVPLATVRGTWSPKGTFAYQWLAGGDPISGATTASFTPTADQLGAGLKVRVSLSAPGYRTKRMTTDPTAGVIPGEFVAATAPAITGTAQVDQPLSASPGQWTPAGRTTLQWLVNGKPVDGATSTTYTPTADDLRKTISVRVTVRQRGYDDATATSVETPNVAPGTFVNSAEPTVTGTAQVGVPLTATRGSWSPRATTAFQWQVDGVDVPDATSETFTPRPQDAGHRVTVVVTASRPGYLTATVPSSQTAAVLPGVMHNRAVPTIVGRAVAGRTLRATDGTWSITPDDFRYQWYAGRTAIKGATGPTYVPTSANAGRRIHLVVTARHLGYTSLSATSATTDRVVLGRISFDQPSLRGQLLVGRTLTAVAGSLTPSSATAAYRWLRNGQPIRGAHDRTYTLRTADLGHRIRVEVSMRATNWLDRTKRSAVVGIVRTAPRLHPHASASQGRILLRLGVESPGLSAPDGTVTVWRGQTRVGRFAVTGGSGSGLLAAMRRGSHVLTIVYRGGELETVARRTFTVTAP